MTIKMSALRLAARRASTILLPLLAASVLIPLSAPEARSAGCEGISLSLQPVGASPAWTLDVPFDGARATLTRPGGAVKPLVLNESCSSRRIVFDLAGAGTDLRGGRCTVVSDGAGVTGGCVVDGAPESPVTGMINVPPQGAAVSSP